MKKLIYPMSKNILTTFKRNEFDVLSVISKTHCTYSYLATRRAGTPEVDNCVFI